MGGWQFRRGYKTPSLTPQYIRGLLLEVTNCRTELAKSPRPAPFPKGSLPTGNAVHSTVADKKLDQVLKARPKPLPTDREMNRRQIMGTPDSVGIDRVGHRQQMREGAALGVHLPMTYGVDAHVGPVLHSQERRAVEC